MFRTSSVHHQERFVQAVFADLVCGNTRTTRHVQPLQSCRKNCNSSYKFVTAGLHIYYKMIHAPYNIKCYLYYSRITWFHRLALKFPIFITREPENNILNKYKLVYAEHFAKHAFKRNELQGEFKLDDCKKSFNFTLHITYPKTYTLTPPLPPSSTFSLCVACPTFEGMHIRTGECWVLWCLNLVP